MITAWTEEVTYLSSDLAMTKISPVPALRGWKLVMLP